jgi:hypothetical protein
MRKLHVLIQFGVFDKHSRAATTPSTQSRGGLSCRGCAVFSRQVGGKFTLVLLMR